MEPQAVPQPQTQPIPPAPPTPQISPTSPVPQVKNSLVLTMSVLLIVTVAIACLFYFQIQKLSKELLKYQSTTPIPAATPIVTTKVDCQDPRPEVCTMECVETPPYICGSDGKSYCTVCQACSNKAVAWYEMRATSSCGEGQFCGGFAGVVCPEGYSCKLDGNYPDAGGVCTKN